MSPVRIERPLIAAGRLGVAACSHPVAAHAAIHVFGLGGNAADAAVAASFALFVVLPQACGLGGDAMVMVSDRDGCRAISGFGGAPKRFTPSLNMIDGRSVGVPGALAALVALHRKNGILPWRSVVDGAVDIAQNITPLSETLTRAIEQRRKVLERHGFDWLLLVDGCAIGDTFSQPALTTTLRRIAAEGITAFTNGPTADDMVDACHAAGGYLDIDDFATDPVTISEPLVMEYTGARVAFHPPPSQAVLAAMALGELAITPLSGRHFRTHTLIQYIDAAFSYRNEVGRSGSAARLLRKRLTVPRDTACKGQREHGKHTAVVSTADSYGSVVTVVASLFNDFGSGVFVPRGGFFLNDRLHSFARDGDSANAPAAGRQPVHTLSPVIIGEPSRRWGIATPGADGQVQFLSQIIDAVLAEGASVGDAIRAPRWRSLFGRLALETDFDRDLEDYLANRGHVIYRRSAADGFFGSAVAAGFTADRNLFASADTRGESVALGL